MNKWFKLSGYERNGVHIQKIVVLKARSQKEAVTQAFPSGETEVVVKRIPYNKVQQLGLQ